MTRAATSKAEKAEREQDLALVSTYRAQPHSWLALRASSAVTDPEEISRLCLEKIKREMRKAWAGNGLIFKNQNHE